MVGLGDNFSGHFIASFVLAGSYATYNVLNTMPTVAKPAVNVGWVERGDTHQAVVMELQPK